MCEANKYFPLLPCHLPRLTATSWDKVGSFPYSYWAPELEATGLGASKKTEPLAHLGWRGFEAHGTSSVKRVDVRSIS